jgi:pSer/pThr/pTyr-binding forkhead associated (FHA) protein
MGSSNGTFVNDEKVKSIELKNNDVISLDEFSFTVIGPDVKEKVIPTTTIKETKKPQNGKPRRLAKIVWY